MPLKTIVHKGHEDMRKFNAENERLKRKYITFIKDTKGRDHKSLDKASSALVRFKESTGFKPFKKFHIDQAGQFKKALSKARNERTGKPLSLATIDATLSLRTSYPEQVGRLARMLTVSDEKLKKSSRLAGLRQNEIREMTRPFF